MASGASSTLTKELRIELKFVTTQFLNQTRTAARALDILNSRLGKTQASANETQDAFRQLAKETRAVGSKENTVIFQQNAKALREVSRSAKGAKTSLNQYSTAVTKAGNRSKDASSKMNGLDASSRKAGKGFSFANASLSGFNAGLSSLFTVIGGRELVKTSLEFDRVRNRLKFATNNTDEFNQALTLTETTADRLGLALVETQRGFSTIAASAKGSALEGRPVVDLFNAISNASAALSLSADETNSVFLAFSQIISKGKVAAEELRGQIGERLPGAFSAAARSLGVTNQELDKLLQDGKVIADDFLPKFAKELNNTFGEQALKNAQSFTAQINRLVNSLKTVADAVAKTQFFRDIVDGYSKIAEAIEAENIIEKSNQNLNDKAISIAKKRIAQLEVLRRKREITNKEFKEGVKSAAEDFKSVFEDVDSTNEQFKEASKIRGFIYKDFIGQERLADITTEYLNSEREITKEKQKQIELDKQIIKLRGASDIFNVINKGYDLISKGAQKVVEEAKKLPDPLNKLAFLNDEQQLALSKQARQYIEQRNADKNRLKTLQEQLKTLKQQKEALKGGTGKVNFIEAIQAGSAASIKLGIEARARATGAVDSNKELLQEIDLGIKRVGDEIEELNNNLKIENA